MIAIPGKIPIQIFPLFWLLIFAIGWLNSGTLEGTAIWAVVIFFSILIHEYGHALTAVFFGQRAKIQLVGLGGLTERRGPPLPKWKDFVVVLCGPLAGFLLFFLTYFILSSFPLQPSVLSYALQVSLHVNLFWTLLNLLPILPLDGGHLMRIGLEGSFGLKGLKFALFISMVLSGFLGFYFFLISQILMGALLFMLTFEGYKAWSEVRDMSSEDKDETLQRTIQNGIQALKEGKLEEALAGFNFVRQQAPKGILYVTATEYASHILVQKGQYQAAYDRLYPLKNRLSPEYAYLLQQLAYRLQEWEEVVEIGQKVYQDKPSVDVALLNACAYAIMGQATPTVGWLRCAAQMGCPNLKDVIQKREFDAVRHTEAFKKWLTTI